MISSNHWQDTNGCWHTIFKGREYIVCPTNHAVVTNITLAWYYNAPTQNIAFLVLSRPDLSPASQWSYKSQTTALQATVPTTNHQEFFIVRASNTITRLVSP